MVLKHLRQAVAPLYLLLCLVLGGSAQGIWANMVLQLIGLAIIAWAAAAAVKEPLVRPAAQLLGLAALAVALVVVQLVPLPASIWSGLGARHALASDYGLLGLRVPALSISLTPYNSVDSLLGLIPPLAMICAIVRLKAARGSFLAVALIAGAIAGVLVGALQVGTTSADASPWYFYPETNLGVAVGFFANANHMAILLVATVPFLAALVAAARRANIQHLSALIAVATGAGLVILVGIAINGSIAAYGLVIPVVLASAAIITPARGLVRPALLTLSILMLVGGVGLIASSSATPGSFGVSTSVQTRQVMGETTLRAVRDFMPLGSGLGSFRKVYPMYEEPAKVDTTYVVHAHDDYAELALETGVPGIVLILLFLIWWATSSWRNWRSVENAPFACAASVSTAAILAHSLVDFPLRTAAISALFGFCLALLADRRTPPPVDPEDLRPTRHFELR